MVFNIYVTRWVEYFDGYERFSSAICIRNASSRSNCPWNAPGKIPRLESLEYYITKLFKCMFKYFDGYFLSHIWSSSYKIHEYNSIQQIIKCYLGSRWPSHLKYLLGIRFEEDWFSNQKTNLFFNIGLSFAHHF